MRLIFMGTPEFAVPSLARLIGEGHEITAVFTQPDKPAGRGNQLHPPAIKVFALKLGITVHQPAKIKTNEEVKQIFERLRPEACVVAAYGKILPDWLLAIPRLGCINVHASLLPKYRGAAPINWAIANGEQLTGVTIMQLDAGMDTGPIIAKQAVEIGKEETAVELSQRLAHLGAELLVQTLPRLERGEVQAVPQDDREATYAPMLRRDDGLIDWRMTALEIANRVRAFQPWPGTYTIFRGARLIIWRAREVTSPRDLGEKSQREGLPIRFKPSTIIDIDRTGFTIACAEETLLHIEELQVEGKRRLSGRDFVNGARLSLGDIIMDRGAG